MKILNGLIAEAHGRFLWILAETRNLEKIRERCVDSPFLIREWLNLKENVKNIKKNDTHWFQMGNMSLKQKLKKI